MCAALSQDPFTQQYQVMRPNAVLQNLVRATLGVGNESIADYSSVLNLIVSTNAGMACWVLSKTQCVLCLDADTRLNLQKLHFRPYHLPCDLQRNGSWQGASFDFLTRYPAFSFSLIHGARSFTAVLINLDNGWTKQCASAPNW